MISGQVIKPTCDQLVKVKYSQILKTREKYMPIYFNIILHIFNFFIYLNNICICFITSISHISSISNFICIFYLQRVYCELSNFGHFLVVKLLVAMLTILFVWLFTCVSIPSFYLIYF